jgi:4-hydroxybenzoate polyprenyltransferase
VRRVRLFIVLARPTVVMLVALFAAIGLAQAGRANDGALLAKTLAAVVASVLFAVAINDLADERIDRINLPVESNRPLIAGTGTRREMVWVAVAAAVVALGASMLLTRPAVLVVALGLAFTAAYSLRPIRIAERGVLAPMLLPLAYVAIPYLLGIFAVRPVVTKTDLLLLGGLYAGFVGRILLKDFRDVRGDALFGKRTFLVRHGRGPTCALSALFLVAGASTLIFVRELSVALVLSYGVYLALTLGVLVALARARSVRREEALIAGAAILGRGMLVTLYAHFAMQAGRWPAPAASAMIAALTATVIGIAFELVRVGPTSSLTVPPDLAALASRVGANAPAK